jgi:hypothetical protein
MTEPMNGQMNGRQRTSAPVRRKRPHPAHGSRIAAAGVGFASMFGIVAGLGWANRPETAGPALVPAPATAPQVVIVVHHSNGATTVSATGTAGAEAPAGTPAAAPAAAGGVPIPLVAQPTVQVAPAAQPANASTHGSR